MRGGTGVLATSHQACVLTVSATLGVGEEAAREGHGPGGCRRLGLEVRGAVTAGPSGLVRSLVGNLTAFCCLCTLPLLHRTPRRVCGRWALALTAPPPGGLGPHSERLPYLFKPKSICVLGGYALFRAGPHVGSWISLSCSAASAGLTGRSGPAPGLVHLL